jgi:hypothetical protein
MSSRRSRWQLGSARPRENERQKNETRVRPNETRVHPYRAPLLRRDDDGKRVSVKARTVCVSWAAQIYANVPRRPRWTQVCLCDRVESLPRS